MKHLLILLFLAFSAAPTAGLQDEPPEPETAIPGAETPRTIKVPGFERALAFARYIVLTKPHDDNVGETIVVYRNSEGVEAAVAAGRAGAPYVELKRPETFFLA